MQIIKHLNFSRKTTSNRFIPEIDGLRFLAIITVVIFHFNTAFSKELGFSWNESIQLLGGSEGFNQWGWWMMRFDMGVKIFFAISGFILALPFLRHYLFDAQEVNLRRYYYRRLTRLEPPFIISLMIFYFVHLFVFNADAGEYFFRLIIGILYSHVIIFGEPNPINPVSWSLETEAQYYLITPAIFFLSFKLKKIINPVVPLVAFFFISVVFKYEFFYNKYLNLNVMSFLHNFIAGVLFAYFYLKKRLTWFHKKEAIFDFLGLLAFFSLFCFYKSQRDYINIIMFNLSIFTLFIAVFKGPLHNWVYTRPVVYTIGGMCYSIYLLHFAFFYLWVKIAVHFNISSIYRINLLFHSIFGIMMVLLVSSIFFILFERPFMDSKFLTKLLSKNKEIKPD